MTDTAKLSTRQLDSFWSRVAFSQDCWFWVGAKSGGGYGRMRASGNISVYAHRVALELSGIDIPDGFDVDHLCHMRACVKPSHLRVASRSENNENFSRAHSHGRSGIRGVSWHSKRRCWRVTVVKSGHQYHGGFYAELDAAKSAAIELRNELYTHNQVDRNQERKSA